MIYKVCLYFSPAIQKQYFEKYGYGGMIPVAANDVAFSIHSVLLTAITLFQIAIYELNSSFHDSHQAVMNFTRKSTDGFSIGNILLDFLGGVENYALMRVQSIDQNSWVNFYGNIGKTLLSLVSIFFGILFMCQHFVLYPVKKALLSRSQ